MFISKQCMCKWTFSKDVPLLPSPHHPPTARPPCYQIPGLPEGSVCVCFKKKTCKRKIKPHGNPFTSLTCGLTLILSDQIWSEQWHINNRTLNSYCRRMSIILYLLLFFGTNMWLLIREHTTNKNIL